MRGRTKRIPGAVLLAVLLLPAIAGASRAEEIRVFAAGSLTAAMKEIVPAAGLPAGSSVIPTFGPAGKLRERIEGGEAADILLSADMAGPERLEATGKLALAPVPFARNRMCLASDASLGVTSENALSRMLSSELRLAISTPVADPGGDYALATFARAEAVSPGAEAILTKKALHLLGGPTTMVPVGDHTPAASIFLGKNADLLLYYCSGSAALAKEVPEIVSVPVPDSIEPGPVYGMALLTEKPAALRLALFLVSGKGQAILGKYGLRPVLPDGR